MIWDVTTVSFGEVQKLKECSLLEKKNILTEAKKLGTVSYVSIEGGEAFLYYPIMIKTIKEALKLGFKKIGSDIILVTHNIELASRFLQEGGCQHLQVEFVNKKPTYKLVPGISRKSHAELVAEKIGFSPTDIRAYLKRKGYLKEK